MKTEQVEQTRLTVVALTVAQSSLLHFRNLLNSTALTLSLKPDKLLKFANSGRLFQMVNYLVSKKVHSNIAPFRFVNVIFH